MHRTYVFCQCKQNMYFDVLIKLISSYLFRQQLENLRPKDSELLSGAPDIVGVIVTLRSSGANECKDENGRDYDFVSRYFAPWLGVSEDPVTGKMCFPNFMLPKQWAVFLFIRWLLYFLHLLWNTVAHVLPLRHNETLCTLFL